MHITRAARTFSSVNAAEVAHFSKLSAQWWDERGEFEFLHKMNPVRMQFIRDKLRESLQDDGASHAPAVAKPFKGLDILDVGCGGGLLSESLARLGARTTAIDASESNISIAKIHSARDPQLNDLNYECTAAETLAQQPKRYDVVCSMEVLEHVDNPTQFLSTCADLVKPGGHLFLSTISRTPLSYFLTIFMAENVLRKVSQGTHTHSKYINPSELIDYFRHDLRWISPNAASLPRTEAEVRGLIYNPLSAGWMLGPRSGLLSSFSTECNYIFWARKPAV